MTSSTGAPNRASGGSGIYAMKRPVDNSRIGARARQAGLRPAASSYLHELYSTAPLKETIPRLLKSDDPDAWMVAYTLTAFCNFTRPNWDNYIAEARGRAKPEDRPAMDAMREAKRERCRHLTLEEYRAIDGARQEAERRGHLSFRARRAETAAELAEQGRIFHEAAMQQSPELMYEVAGFFAGLTNATFDFGLDKPVGGAVVRDAFYLVSCELGYPCTADTNALMINSCLTSGLCNVPTLQDFIITLRYQNESDASRLFAVRDVIINSLATGIWPPGARKMPLSMDHLRVPPEGLGRRPQ